MPLPFVEAEFAETGERIRTQRISVTRAAYKHEVAVLRVHSDYSAKYTSGAPVRVRWGRFPSAQEDFYGYVHHGNPVHDPTDRTRSGGRLIDLVCVGATGKMGETQSRSWLNTRVDMMAADLAAQHQLHVGAESGRKVLSNVVQAGESSWKFLARYAEAESFILFGFGAKVVIADRARAFGSLAEHAPLFRQGESVKLMGSVGELNVVGRDAVSREGYGLGRDGLVAFTDQKRTSDIREIFRPEPRERRIVTGAPADHAGDLAVSIDSRRREEAFLDNLDLAVSSLRPGLAPCSPVRLDSFGPRFDGFWSVDEVTFTVFPSSQSSTTMKLVKSPSDVNVRPRRTGQRPADTHRVAQPMPVRLVGDRWAAS